MAKNWRIVRPRKQAKPENRVVTCVMCQNDIDREKDAQIKDPEGNMWCLNCGEIIMEERLDDYDHEVTAIKRTLLKLVVIRKEME